MSTSRRIDLHYTLEMQSNFHIGSGAGIAGLVDRAVLRLANDELVVPGSTVKGRVRYRAEQLVRTQGISTCGGRARDAALCKPESHEAASRNLCLICRLFGSEWQPATLYFSDARLSESLREIVLREIVDQQREKSPDPASDYQVIDHTRTRIDRWSRRVVEGALYTFQEGIAGLTFEGRIQGSLLCVDAEGINLPLEVLTLLAALRLVEGIGGKKTVGLGVCKATVKRLDLDGETFKEPVLHA